MIQGVQAQTVIFVDFRQAALLTEQVGWPWLGFSEAEDSTRRVRLNVASSEEFRFRLLARKRDHGTVRCRVQVEVPESVAPIPLVRGHLIFEPALTGVAITRTELTFRGFGARSLLGGAGHAPADGLRHRANEYARALVDEIASAMEQRRTFERPSTGRPCVDRRPLAGAGA